MFFAKQLAEQTDSLRHVRVKEIAKRFTAACERAASRLESECIMTFSHELTVLRLECMCMGLLPLPVQAVNDIAKKLLAQLENLGFTSLRVEALPGARIRIQASWGDEATPPPSACSSGSLGNCGICHQKTALVVLAPCGHTLCMACQRRLPRTVQVPGNFMMLSQCPFCRRTVQMVTDGLFFSSAA